MSNNLRKASQDMLDAFDKVAKICWHTETAGSPPLSNEQRWEIVNLYRDVHHQVRDALAESPARVEDTKYGTFVIRKPDGRLALWDDKRVREYSDRSIAERDARNEY